MSEMFRALAPLVAQAALLAQPAPMPLPGGGPPPFGPPMGTRKLLAEFDKDGDKRLNAEERAAARRKLAESPRPRFGPPGGFPFGPGGRGPGGPPPPPPEAGPRLQPAGVKVYANEPLYDTRVLRTLFIEFENPDWEKELAAFHHTDVEVPATLTVDGRKIEGIGVHFRGNSSFMMVEEGRKRSLNLSIDWTDKDARLAGYRTLNLLNANQDPTFLRAGLFLDISRTYIAAPLANHVRVVINGELWGIYINVEQFNTDFTKRAFKETSGRRWKVPGSPMARGGLEFLGDDPAEYKRHFEIKSRDDKASWEALIRLCRTLNQTPAADLPAALEPMLDVDGALKFLALEKVFINADGYWSRASDYNLYQDSKGRFHVIPHDANETLAPAEMMGPPGGFGRGPGGPRGPRPGTSGEGRAEQPPDAGGPPPGFGPPTGFGPPPGGSGGRPPRPPADAKLDPFAGQDDPRKPLLHKLLAVPAYRDRYIGYVREMATTWLDWKRLEPMIRERQQLIAADVARDTRKLYSTEAFTRAITEEVTLGRGPGGGQPHMSLRTFVESRRQYLLNHPALAK
ncbi:MAG: spore coat protein CotH [Acidobacteria bacterium]|nr:spore coat protein CotH [Acidobacteriota bacterium]